MSTINYRDMGHGMGQQILPIWFSPHKVRKTAVFVMKTAVFGCGGRTRTYDLRVMSPTSFQLLYSAIFHYTLECLDIIAWADLFVKPLSFVSI